MAKDMRSSPPANEAASSAGTENTVPTTNTTGDSQTTTPATPATGPPTVDQQTPPAAPALTVTRDELRSIIGEMTQEFRGELQARDQIAKVQADEIANLRRELQTRPTSITVQEVEKKEKDDEKLQRILKGVDDTKEAAEADLLAGPFRFSVSTDREPRMDKIVGGQDESHAKAKYEKFFGIRANMDAEKQTRVTRIGPAPAV